MNLTDEVDIQGLVRKHNSDYYYKAFKSRTHLITMLFGILSQCDSMTEIRARLKNTSESWVACIFFVMNLVHYQANYFFDSFFRWFNCEPQRILVRNAHLNQFLESKLTTRNEIWEIRYW